MVNQFTSYLAEYATLNISIITYYEIMSGLKHRNANKQLASFLMLASHSTILPLTEHSVATSSDMYARLRLLGTPVDDIDLLIAGVAVANGLILATHNRKHFDRIDELQTEDWSLA
ncbi:MAG: type II toxin-antitoxin system VapC family toxin [Caldilineaceae bacterium]